VIFLHNPFNNLALILNIAARLLRYYDRPY
jgi:hypothetical protein